MRKIIVYILIVLILIPGCARTVVIKQDEAKEEFFARVTRLCNKREVKVNLLNNESFIAHGLVIENDSARFVNEAGSKEGIAAAHINKIVYNDKLPSALTGFGIGAASGLLLDLGLGSMGVFGKEYSLQGMIAIILIPIISITIGTYIGIEDGSRVEIKLNN